MNLTLLRSAAGATLVTAMATADYAAAADEPRYVVVALVLAIEAAALVIRAAGIGRPCGSTGIVATLVTPTILSWSCVGLNCAVLAWALLVGIGPGGIVGILVSGHAVMVAHVARYRDEMPVHPALKKG